MPVIANYNKLVEPVNHEPQLINLNGLRIHISTDSSDHKRDEKLEAIRHATELISQRVPNAYNIFRQLGILEVYFGENVLCEACWFPEQHDGTRFMFLGNKMMFLTNKLLPHQDPISGIGTAAGRGLCDQLYDDKRMSHFNFRRWKLGKDQYQATKRNTKMTAIVVHEFGHIFHEFNAQANFWLLKGDITNHFVMDDALASQVSFYVRGSNYLEFVAEVFTGLVHGKQYSMDVRGAYLYWGGMIVQ